MTDRSKFDSRLAFIKNQKSVRSKINLFKRQSQSQPPTTPTNKASLTQAIQDSVAAYQRRVREAVLREQRRLQRLQQQRQQHGRTHQSNHHDHQESHLNQHHRPFSTHQAASPSPDQHPQVAVQHQSGFLIPTSDGFCVFFQNLLFVPSLICGPFHFLS